VDTRECGWAWSSAVRTMPRHNNYCSARKAHSCGVQRRLACVRTMPPGAKTITALAFSARCSRDCLPLRRADRYACVGDTTRAAGASTRRRSSAPGTPRRSPVGQDAIDQVRCRIGHAPAGTARAEAATLACEATSRSRPHVSQWQRVTPCAKMSQRKCPHSSRST
jgi:hypothetical protein